MCVMHDERLKGRKRKQEHNACKNYKLYKYLLFQCLLQFIRKCMFLAAFVTVMCQLKNPQIIHFKTVCL